MPTKSLSRRFATMAVVPLPINGSNTAPPLRASRKDARLYKFKWVGGEVSFFARLYIDRPYITLVTDVIIAFIDTRLL